MTGSDFAIIGAGATGTLLACQLLSRTNRPLTIHLIDRTGTFAQGAAYAARRDTHTLNVMAKLMGGATESDADGFIRFAAAALGGCDPASLHDRYLPRALYGRYLQHLLATAESNAAAGAHLHRVAAEALDIERTPEGRFRLTFTSGAPLLCDRVALCLGNLDPAPLAETIRSARSIDAPWQPGVLDSVAPGDRIVIIGTGLTMVDTVLELAQRGHTAPIVALSRRGLVPATDAPSDPYPDFFAPSLARQGILAVLRAVRAEIKQARQRGIGWHAVVEAFRVHTSAIWQALDDANRRRFLRHLRTPWLTFRHRLPPQHAHVLDALRRNGSVRIIAARLAGIATGETATPRAVRIQRRGAAGTETIQADWVINCIGPDGDYTRARLPLVRNLLRRGLARPDPYRLGLDIAEDFSVLDAHGAAVPGLVTLGPPTRGRFWEVTAVPHLRRQVERYVAGLVD